MLTASELLDPPGFECLDFPSTQEYFDSNLLPRLVDETFGTDGCMVADSAGVCRHIMVILTDGIAQALMENESRYWTGNNKLRWRLYLFDLALCKVQIFQCMGLSSAYKAFLPCIDTCMAVLDTWLDVYVANKDPLQHFPKIRAERIEDDILKTIVNKFAMTPFDPVQMRLADRLDELGLQQCKWRLTRNWSYTPLPNPDCLLFLARGHDMGGVLRYLSTCPPEGALAANLLRCLITIGRRQQPFDITFIERVRPLHGPVVSQIVARLNTGIYLEDLAHEALAVLVKALEDDRVMCSYPYFHDRAPDGRKARILLDLVITYRTQVHHAERERRRMVYYITRRLPGLVRSMIRELLFVPDPALMARAKAMMERLEQGSWPYDTAPVVAGQKRFWYEEPW